MLLLVYLIGIALACFMAWGLGANDASNPTECAVGAGVISVRRAVILFAIFAALGGILLGHYVMKTFDRGLIDRKTALETGVVSKEVLVTGSLTAALSAAIWVTLSTWLGMPVSTTHSAIGAVLGFGIVACPNLLVLGRLKLVVLGIVLSPLLSLLLAYTIYKVLNLVLLRVSRLRVLLFSFSCLMFVTLGTSISLIAIFIKEPLRLFLFSALTSVSLALLLVFLLFLRSKGEDLAQLSLSTLLLISLCFSAFAFGANDLANATGVFVTPTEIMVGKPTHTTMFLLSLLGSFFIAIGGLMWGYKVITTAAYGVTKLDPLTGFSAEFSNATAVFLFTTVPGWLTGFGIPISTTHSSIGSIIGAGLAAGGLKNIHRTTTVKIVLFWAITIPCAMLISAGLFAFVRWLIL